MYFVWEDKLIVSPINTTTVFPGAATTLIGKFYTEEGLRLWASSEGFDGVEALGTLVFHLKEDGWHVMSLL